MVGTPVKDYSKFLYGGEAGLQATRQIAGKTSVPAANFRFLALELTSQAKTSPLTDGLLERHPKHREKPSRHLFLLFSAIHPCDLFALVHPSRNSMTHASHRHSDQFCSVKTPRSAAVSAQHPLGLHDRRHLSHGKREGVINSLLTFYCPWLPGRLSKQV
jgi:hypothetical protein